MTDARMTGQTDRHAWVAWMDGDQRCYAIINHPRYFEAQVFERDGHASIAYSERDRPRWSIEQDIVIQGRSIVAGYRQVEREAQELEQYLSNQREQRLALEKEQPLALERERHEQERAQKETLAQKLESLRERGFQIEVLKPGRSVKGHILPRELDLKEGRFLGIRHGDDQRIKLVPASDKLREFQRDQKQVRVTRERNGTLKVQDPKLERNRGRGR